MTQLKNLPDIDPIVPAEDVDTAVADALVPYAGDAAVRALGAVAELSDQEPLYAAAAGVLATAVVMRDGSTWRTGTRILAAHLLATALRGVVKSMVDRTRPEAAARRGDYVLRKGERHESDFNSFPSGHTAGAVAVAMAVGRDHPGARWPAFGLATLTGAAQIVRSRHYVTDVVAGAVIGVAAELLVDAVIVRASKV
ncbi:phosphatase PAP2 family protein [Sphingomonas glaciei]|uniref:Phosphatase PAP2 family protein n=1 Tax=Sphingomonas glaciei TaxID=2938948 RepID=A0ABY5MY13_9SPHN|nr:phosphatase PAP2 family protein [Sphingomonas glaciei]UUR08655.1 phosphatase PAP2 family protein [Sphingomonas glaciei]